MLLPGPNNDRNEYLRHINTTFNQPATSLEDTVLMGCEKSLRSKETADLLDQAILTDCACCWYNSVCPDLQEQWMHVAFNPGSWFHLFN